MTIVYLHKPTPARDTWLVFAVQHAQTRGSEPVHDARREFPADQYPQAFDYAQRLSATRHANRIVSD